jgi:hypothetical protein
MRDLNFSWLSQSAYLRAEQIKLGDGVSLTIAGAVARHSRNHPKQCLRSGAGTSGELRLQWESGHAPQHRMTVMRLSVQPVSGRFRCPTRKAHFDPFSDISASALRGPEDPDVTIGSQTCPKFAKHGDIPRLVKCRKIERKRRPHSATQK